MPINETQLKAHLKDGVLSRVYFLYGEESYLSSHYAQKIADKAVDNPALAEFNFHKFDGQTCTIDDIEEAAEALPVMAERKCVLVRDWDITAGGAAVYERTLALASDMPEGCVLIYWLDAVEADFKKNAKWKAFLAAVEKAGTAVCFPRKTEADLIRILCTGAARRNAVLKADNARLMLERCGNDLRLLNGELDKLCALRDGGEVTKADIEALGTQNLEASVFDLSKALLQNSYIRAYEILHRLFTQREEPVAILGVLSTSYADLYRAKVAAAAGLRAETLADDFAYKGKEFRLRNAVRDSSRLSIPVLRESLEILAGADRLLKSSRTDKRLVLEETVARLILLSKQGTKS